MEMTETRAPALSVRDLSFSYAAADGSPANAPVLERVSLEVPRGAFALLTGGTGSGKTTLLRLAKPEVSPAGELSGTVEVLGSDVRAMSAQTSAQLVGFVLQSPDNQIVCDTVWHEMAFGLENLGLSQGEMRRRVAETCYFFGMEPLLHRRCDELSGGQRQMLALAATLAMHPGLLLLDEPTSMLDPVAEKAFLSLLFRANRELGISVVVATHSPWTMAEYATCAFRVGDGRVDELPLEGLRRAPRLDVLARRELSSGGRDVISVDDAWFRYDRDADWVLRGCDLSVSEGEVRALMGGNGSGKSTLLSLVAGVERPQRGRARGTLAHRQAILPQGPKTLLACQSVSEELMEWSGTAGYGEKNVEAVMARLGLAGLGARHPYDLSGGQQQLLALAKLMLTRPRLLLLDEPTKGLDLEMRREVARMVGECRDEGVTVVIASHDVAFLAEVADRTSLLFDGAVTLTGETDEFLRESWVWGR